MSDKIKIDAEIKANVTGVDEAQAKVRELAKIIGMANAESLLGDMTDIVKVLEFADVKVKQITKNLELWSKSSSSSNLKYIDEYSAKLAEIKKLSGYVSGLKSRGEAQGIQPGRKTSSKGGTKFHSKYDDEIKFIEEAKKDLQKELGRYYNLEDASDENYIKMRGKLEKRVHDKQAELKTSQKTGDSELSTSISSDIKRINDLIAKLELARAKIKEIGGKDKQQPFLIDGGNFVGVKSESLIENGVKAQSLNKLAVEYQNAKDNGNEELAELIISEVSKAYENTKSSNVKNLAKNLIGGTKFNDDVIERTWDFEYQDSIPELFKRLQKRYAEIYTDFQAGLADSGGELTDIEIAPQKEMKKRWDEIEQKKQETKAQIESLRTEQQQQQYKTDTYSAIEQVGNQIKLDAQEGMLDVGSTKELINLIISQIKDALRVGNSEGIQIGNFDTGLFKGQNGKLTQSVNFDSEDTDSDAKYVATTDEEAEKSIASIRDGLLKIKQMLLDASDVAQDFDQKIALKDMADSVDTKIKSLGGPSDKTIQTNLEESFNRVASILTRASIKDVSVQSYATASGRSFDDVLEQSFGTGDDADYQKQVYSISKQAREKFYSVLKKDMSNIDEALSAFFSIRDDEIAEVYRQIQQFKGDSNLYEQFKAGLINQLTPGAKSINQEKIKEDDISLPPTVQSKDSKKMTPKERYQGLYKGQLVLGAYGKRTAEEGIEEIDSRMSSLLSKSNIESSRLSEALKERDRILAKYDTKDTKSGLKVLWSESELGKDEIAEDKKKYQKAQKIISKTSPEDISATREIQKLSEDKTILLDSIYEKEKAKEEAIIKRGKQVITSQGTSLISEPTDTKQEELNQEIQKEIDRKRELEKAEEEYAKLEREAIQEESKIILQDSKKNSTKQEDEPIVVGDNIAKDEMATPIESATIKIESAKIDINESQTTIKNSSTKQNDANQQFVDANPFADISDEEYYSFQMPDIGYEPSYNEETFSGQVRYNESFNAQRAYSQNQNKQLQTIEQIAKAQELIKGYQSEQERLINSGVKEDSKAVLELREKQKLQQSILESKRQELSLLKQQSNEISKNLLGEQDRKQLEDYKQTFELQKESSVQRGVNSAKQQLLSETGKEGKKQNSDYIKQLAQLRKLESMQQRADYRTKNARTSQQQIDYQAESTVLQQRIDAIKNNESFRNFDVNQLSAEEQAKVLDIEQKRAQEANNINGYYRQQQTIFQKLFGTVQQSVNRFFDFTAATMIINKVRDTVKQVIGYVQELDSKIVDLQIATGGTRDEMEAMLKDYNNIAKELGRTTSSVADAANDWLRAGYEGKESAELVRASMYLSTLGMMKAEDATSALISVLKGWKLESSDIIGIVDKLVKVDMSAAVKASDIAEAMAKVNYSAQNAGMSIDTLIGLLTTGMEVSQQAPELVGNAWRTVFARANNVKAQKFVATQEDTQAEGYDEQEFEALNDVETVLGSMGIQMRETATKWREVEDILNEIATNWNTYNGVQQSAIANAMAGTRQREQFMVAMQNWDSVLAYEGIAMDSYGTAAEKMTAYTDSIEAARNRITAAIEELALNIRGTELFKGFYNAIAFLTENIGTLAILGTLVLVITNLGQVINMGINAFGSLRTKLIDVSTSFDRLKQSINSISTQAAERKGTVSRYVNQYNVDRRIDSYANDVAKLSLSPTKMGVFKATQRELLSMSGEDQKGVSSIISRIFKANETNDTYSTLLRNGYDVFGNIGDSSKLSFLESLQSYTKDGNGQSELDSFMDAIKNSTDETKDFGPALSQASKMLKDPDLAKAFAEYQRELEESGKKTRLAVEGAINLIAGGVGLLSGQFAGGWIGERLGGENGKATGRLIGGTINSVISTKLADQLNKSIADANGNLIQGFKGLGSLTKVGLIAEGVLSIVQIIVAWRQEQSKKQQERVKAAIEDLNTAQSSYSIAQQIDKLAYGVDSLGRNVTLSNEDYEKFINLNNQLGEQYPSLINRTDELGNTFLDLNKAGGGLTAKFEELIKISQRRADSEFMQVKGGESEYSRQVKAAAENISNTNEQRAKAISSAVNKIESGDFLNVSSAGAVSFDTYTEYQKKLTFDLEKMNTAERLALEKAAKDYGQVIEQGQKVFEITTKEDEAGTNLFLNKVGSYLANTSDYDQMIEDQKRQMVDTYNVKIRNMRDQSNAEAIRLLEETTGERQAIIDAALATVNPLSSEAEIPKVISKLNEMFDGMKGQKYGEYSFEELMYMIPDDFNTYDEGIQAREALKEFLQGWVMQDGVIDDLEKAILVKANFEVEADGVTISDETDLVNKIQESAEGLGISIDTTYLKTLPINDLNNVYNWIEKGYIGSGSSDKQIKDLLRINKTATTSEEAANLATTLSQSSQKYIDNDSISKFFTEASSTAKEFTMGDISSRFSELPINVQEAIKNTYESEKQQIYELLDTIDDTKMGVEEYEQAKANIIYNSSKKIEEAIANEIDSLNEQKAALMMKEAFGDIDLGSDGLISSAEEVITVIDKITESMNKLRDAENEYIENGKVTLKTFMEMVSMNPENVQLFTFDNNEIQVAQNAEETLFELQKQAMIQSLTEWKNNELIKQAELQAEKDKLQAIYDRLEAGEEVVEVQQVQLNNAVQAAEVEAGALAELGNQADATRYKIYAMWAAAAGGSYNGATAEEWLGKAAEAQSASAQAQVSGKFDTYKQNSALTTITYTQEDMADLKEQIDGLTDQLASSAGTIDGIDASINAVGKTTNADEIATNLDSGITALKENTGAMDALKEAVSLADAKINSLNKEWYQMQAWQNGQTVTNGGMDQYYSQMRTFLQQKLQALKAQLATLTADTEEYYEVLAQISQTEVDLANQDDEQAEDKISILESQGLLNDNVIAAYQNLLNAADTEAEYYEYLKRMNDKIKEQKNLIKQLLGYQQDLLSTLLEYERYTPNSTYYMNIITRSEANLRQQMQNSADRAKTAYNLLYEASYKNWKNTGASDSIAAQKAAYEASQDSDYQQAVKDYIQAYQALAQVAMDVFNDKVDALQRRLDDIEDSRANEWSSISQIKSYYESIKELQESIRDEAAEALKNIDDLTDEQVQELVDKYNEALKDINQNMIDYYSDIKDYQESIYSALGNEVGRYKEQLEEQKKIVEENYDMELQKLQDKQSSITRTNKLLEIQRGLQDATENRSRIYREGLGFVYETDRNKIKEAEQQLKDFQLQDRIDDLQNAKDAELKLLDDRINAWDEYLKMMEQKYSEYDRLQEQHLLKQLLNLQTQEEVTALITGDMLSFSDYSDNNQDKFLDDMIGAYMGFDTKFGTFLDDYKSNLEMLKFYNEQSLSFLDAGNYNRVNGAFLENVIEENLAPINPQIEYRSSGGGGVAAPQYKNADFYGGLGQYDYSRQSYTYDTSSDPEAVKKLQTTIAGIVGASTTDRNSELYILVDGKIGSQTAAYIEQILASGNSSDIDTLNAALSAAGVSYNPNFNYGGNTGSARDYTSYYGYTYDSGNHDVSSYGTVTSTGRSVDYANNGHDKSEVLAAQQAYNREHPNNKIAEDGKWGAETSAAFNGLSARQYFGNASGILAGPVTYTGLTMLHGTPSSPEYVLNSDQAYSLLRYMATTKPETVAPGCGDTIYNFTGGITMNGVNDPEAFFGELMKATSNRFNVTKNRY